MRRFLCLSLLSLAATLPVADLSAGESISGVKVTSVKTKNNWTWNIWSVTVTFKIHRKFPKAPPPCLCFKVWLRENDIGPYNDESFGPVIITVLKKGWTKTARMGHQAKVSVTFKGISDFYGTDWYVTGSEVTMVPCPKKAARVGGGIGHDENKFAPSYSYSYSIENDPYRVASNPRPITDLVVGDQFFSLNPPVMPGGATRFTILDPRPPIADDPTTLHPSEVPYMIIYDDGTTEHGYVSGPAGTPRVAAGDEAKIGTTYPMDLWAPDQAGQSYLAASSLGAFPGIDLGPNSPPLFLNPDALMALSLVPSGLFTGYSGSLDANGKATASIQVPPLAELVGMRIFTGFITVDSTGITGVSNPQPTDFTR